MTNGEKLAKLMGQAIEKQTESALLLHAAILSAWVESLLEGVSAETIRKRMDAHLNAEEA